MADSKKKFTRDSEFVRGVKAAADVIVPFNSCSTHAYRLDDVILGKLNVVARKRPRKNDKRLRNPDDAWFLGFIFALSEMHRRLSLAGKDAAHVREMAVAAQVTIATAKLVGASAFELRQLRKAGVR